jgi:hypothetical protein
MSRESTPVLGRRSRDPLDDALKLGVRKKPYVHANFLLSLTAGICRCRTLTDPLVHYGRHFGRVVYAFCNVKILLTNGLERLAQDHEDADGQSLTAKYELPCSVVCRDLVHY